jgi:hypothetical protein
MSNKKQTAVEWLEMEIVKLEKNYAIPYIIYILCEQAKAMEKEQIEESFKNAKLPTLFTKTLTAEQYYKETYEH